MCQGSSEMGSFAWFCLPLRFRSISARQLLKIGGLLKAHASSQIPCSVQLLDRNLVPVVGFAHVKGDEGMQWQAAGESQNRRWRSSTIALRTWSILLVLLSAETHGSLGKLHSEPATALSSACAPYQDILVIMLILLQQKADDVRRFPLEAHH